MRVSIRTTFSLIVAAALSVSFAGAMTTSASAHQTGSAGVPAGSILVENPGNLSSYVGSTVKQQMTAVGGMPPYTWSATGLPPGLSINVNSGLVSGKPTTWGTYSVVVAAKDMYDGFGSTGFTWTIRLGRDCVGQQLLGNPGFETGAAAPWAASPNVIQNSGSGQTAHAGNWFAWLDGDGQAHTDTLSQTITIPAGCRVKLNFWLKITTDEIGSTFTDKLTVKAGNTVLATYSNLNTNVVYQHRSFEISQYAGQSVSISFTGTEDNARQTSFLIDDATADYVPCC